MVKGLGQLELSPRNAAALAVCAVGGAILVWTFVRGHRLPIEVHGRRYLDGFVACDGATLMRYTFKAESEANGYTAAKLAEVCRALVLPTLERYKLNRRFVVSSDDQPSAIAAVTGTDADGTVHRLSVQVWQTPDGPRGLFLRNAFYCSHNAIAAETGVQPGDRRTLAQSSHAVYAQHGNLLRRLGITQYAGLDMQTGQIQLTNLARNHQRYGSIIASGFQGVTAKSWGPWSDPSYWGPGR